MKRIILFLTLYLLLASPAMVGTKNCKKLLDECSYVATTDLIPQRNYLCMISV